jgi:serine protease Do
MDNNFIQKIKARRLVPTFVVLATLIVGILIGTVVSKGVKGKTNDFSDATPLMLQSATPQQLSNSFATIAKRIEPSVVNINTESNPKPNPHARNRRRGGDNGGGGGQGDMQDFFDRFFGGQGGGGEDGQGPDASPFGQMPDQRERALGSGVIVDRNGYILTNNHVVDKADRIRVKLAGDPPGVLYDAKVVGVDKDTDIAVIKIDPKGKELPAAKLGNSDQAQVGDWVLAIGSPFGLEATVTAGIVSYKGRGIPGDSSHQFQQFIQTDAAINPGNSGGPLVDMNGNVIGINTAIYTESMGYMGVGFAMPANIVQNVYNQLIGGEHRVVRGSIGVMFNAEPNPAIARMYGKGVTVTQVTPGGPAEKGGLKVEDTITSVNGTPINNGDQLVNIIAGMKPGSTAKLEYMREGKPATANITIQDRAQLFKDQDTGDEDSGGNNAEPQSGKLGVVIRAIPSDMAQRMNLPAGRGVLVVDVKPGSLAEDIGLIRGAIILDLNRKPVASEQDFRDRVNAIKSGEDVVMLVRQPGRSGGTVLLSGTMP